MPDGQIDDGKANVMPFLSEQSKQLPAAAGANGRNQSPVPDLQSKPGSEQNQTNNAFPEESDFFDRENYVDVDARDYPFDDFGPSDDEELDRLDHLVDYLMEEQEEKLAA